MTSWKVCDGILLIRHLVRPSIHTQASYEEWCATIQKDTLRDSLKLLPRGLSALAKSLCPELGGKGKLTMNQSLY
uniref:Uncharacterized protein n=1 Tax=Utricularia reniformis TaxID=192314 RepID=A0A1Y0B185_9LAMI|nr:hypothetical protein AEK19_MT0992 [Utricularia reniformis]ART31216.1 hypothetical protein AEK19_MT0992 [Utricularia reniformis]